MKAVSGNIKIEMAQYNELSSFSQFSSDLDSATKELLDNGQKVLEILKKRLTEMPSRICRQSLCK